MLINMKDANKLIQYVKKGSLHKVKRCIRKWKKEGESVKDVKTGSGRTLLHLACCHGEDAITRVLLRAGCDANAVDKDGNVPIHLALNCVLEGDIHLMGDLVEPLVNATLDDVIQRQRNHLGLTPALLLSRARSYVAEHNKASSSRGASSSWHKEEQDSDRDWNEKLSSEWAYEMDGDSYWTSFNGGNHRQEETYDAWAERLTFEYHTKRNTNQEKHQRKSKKTRDKSKKENEKLLLNHQKEHEKYLQKQKQKADTRLRRKKEEYLVLSNNFFNNNDDSSILGYEDIPWPGRMPNVEGMLEVLQHGVEPESLKKFVLSQLRFWHPDKFKQKFGQRLNVDKERILQQVNELSQGLNKLTEDKNN